MFVEKLAGRTLGGADSSFVIGSWRADASSSGKPPQPIAPLHVHHLDDEAWYVLSGRLGFQLDRETVEVRAGGGMLVPRGTAHTFWNPGPEPAQYLIVMPPRVAALVAALHDEAEVEPPADIFRRFASELLS
jgi:mannose-6-phosphate isomerase-like protein (cupin superfamily)